MIEDFHRFGPYSLEKDEKRKLLLDELNQLMILHREKCPEYDKFLNTVGFSSQTADCLEQIPFLPIRIFKHTVMKSISKEKIFKTMMSSGTSGQEQAKIYLDKENAILQQKVMLRILGDFVGTKRLPMLIIDSETTVRDRFLFTTRGATIMGLDFMAKKMVFALRDDMTLDVEVLTDFVNEYGEDKFIIFGFTFMVWQHLFEVLQKMHLNINLSNGFLLTAGGWKKLENKEISNDDFKRRGKTLCGIEHYVDHYGMAEQTGSIYAECEEGHLHASIYSDIIIRRAEDFASCGFGEKGFIQVLSCLPRSYPGFSLLSEDEGLILGEDDCPCGRKGKYIKVLGRMKNAEIRGCSNTYASGI